MTEIPDPKETGQTGETWDVFEPPTLPRPEPQPEPIAASPSRQLSQSPAAKQQESKAPASNNLGNVRVMPEMLTRIGIFLAALLFLAAPFGIMSFVGPAMGQPGHSPVLDLISIVCFFWFLAGLFGAFITFGNMFSDE